MAKFFGSVTIQVVMDVPFTEEEIVNQFHEQNVILAGLKLVLPDGSVHKGDGDIVASEWELVEEDEE